MLFRRSDGGSRCRGSSTILLRGVQRKSVTGFQVELREVVEPVPGLPKIKSPAHVAFEIGIFFKGLDGAAEIVGAFMLLSSRLVRSAMPWQWSPSVSLRADPCLLRSVYRTRAQGSHAVRDRKGPARA